MPLATNFRRDLAGKVYSLSQYAALQPVADKNYDVAKMNERFIKLNNAVRVCFDAIADIASRDSSFLPSFFQGFVNPVYVKSQAYTDKSMYKLINGFNTNGTPVTFPEERIVYSYPDVGDITTEDYEYLLFKNGELMDSTLYAVDNSAFGMKAYVKSSAVANNDVITLAVHRVFNRSYQMWKYVFSAAANGLDTIIDVSANFPSFYDVRYLKLAVRKSTDADYDLIDPSKYSIVYDSANQKARVVVNSAVAFAKFDTLIIYDCTSFWKTTITGTNSSGGDAPIPKVPLTQTIASTGENVPVGVLLYRDLDIWLNGRHLIPGKHFVISPGYQENSNRWSIDFLISVPNGTTYRLDIIKNVPFSDTETVYVVKDALDSKGIEYVSDSKYPVLPGLGEMYINGRFIDPMNITAAHKQVLVVNNVKETKDFFFKMSPPVTVITSGMLSEHMNRVTEFDQTVEALGGVGELIARLKIGRSDLSVTDKPNVLSTVGGTAIDPMSVAVEDVVKYVQKVIADAFTAGTAIYNLDAYNTAMIDTNAMWDISILTSDPLLDANVYIPSQVVLDANT
jgi:hypothetical protein